MSDDYERGLERGLSRRRFISPEVNLGAILQAITVIGSVAYAVFTAGTWVSQVRGDFFAVQKAIQQEVSDRKEGTTAVERDIARIERLEETAQRDAAAIQRSQADAMATLSQRLDVIEDRYQHLFSRYQPQPRQR